MAGQTAAKAPKVDPIALQAIGTRPAGPAGLLQAELGGLMLLTLVGIFAIAIFSTGTRSGCASSAVRARRGTARLSATSAGPDRAPAAA